VRHGRKITAIGLREGTSMVKDKDNAVPQEQEPGNSGSRESGSTIPKSNDGVWVTSTPGGSSFEPEEDVPAQDKGESAGGPDRKA
jgi:hypothetical protein